MPTVGTDWYPVVIDNYVTAEYADLDAYLASEYGQDLLTGCGVSAVVPLETAVARLAENDINITVHGKEGLYKRDSGGANGLVVDKNGQAVYFMGGQVTYVMRYVTATPRDCIPTDANDETVAGLVNSFGIGTQLPDSPSDGGVYTIDGITYTLSEMSSGYSFTPDPPAWT